MTTDPNESNETPVTEWLLMLTITLIGVAALGLIIELIFNRTHA